MIRPAATCQILLGFRKQLLGIGFRKQLLVSFPIRAMLPALAALMLCVWGFASTAPAQAQYAPRHYRTSGHFVKHKFQSPAPQFPGPSLQGATMGTIGPPGPSIEIIQGVMTSGTVKVPRKSNIELITICAFASSILVIAVLTFFKKANLWLFGASFAVILVISGIAIGVDQLNDPSQLKRLPLLEIGASCG